VDAAPDRRGDLRRYLDGGGAIRCATSLPEGEEASIVVVSADGGWKYLSTGAWTDDLDEVTERAKGIIYF
jgi:cysteine synthase B